MARLTVQADWKVTITQITTRYYWVKQKSISELVELAWGSIATTEEDQIRSCQSRTGVWGYNGHRTWTVWRLEIGKTLPDLMNFVSCWVRIWHQEWTFRVVVVVRNAFLGAVISTEHGLNHEVILNMTMSSECIFQYLNNFLFTHPTHVAIFLLMNTLTRPLIFSSSVCRYLIERLHECHRLISWY